MSYCRWSTDSFRCDLYCYADVRGGWTTHVATMRVPDSGPTEDHSLMNQGEAGIAEWLRQHEALMAWLQSAEKIRIGGLYDGKTFRDSTLVDFRKRLVALRAAGYRYPDYVLEMVDRERREAGAEVPSG